MAMLRGTAFWAKVVGNAPKGYADGPAEWSFDVAITGDQAASLVDNGADVYVKTPKNEEDHAGLNYVTFKRPAVKSDGTPAKPFRIVGSDREPWDGKTLIGNGSEINVHYVLNEMTYGKNKGKFKPAALAIQVVKLEPYVGKPEFPTYDETGNEESWD